MNMVKDTDEKWRNEYFIIRIELFFLNTNKASKKFINN